MSYENDTPDEILPCPFCGGVAAFGVGDDDGEYAGGHFIACDTPTCQASTALIFATGDDPKPLLLERWNRRSPQTTANTDEGGQ